MQRSRKQMFGFAQDLTKKEIERVMELLVELPGEAETMKKGELMDALKTLGVDSISGNNKTHAVKRMAIMRAIRESKGQMALYRLSKARSEQINRPCLT